MTNVSASVNTIEAAPINRMGGYSFVRD
jgi:hypothetical protein